MLSTVAVLSPLAIAGLSYNKEEVEDKMVEDKKTELLKVIVQQYRAETSKRKFRSHRGFTGLYSAVKDMNQTVTPKKDDASSEDTDHLVHSLEQDLNMHPDERMVAKKQAGRLRQLQVTTQSILCLVID